MSKMTIEEAIREAKKEGMFFTNLYERREGGWQCFLRYESNGLLAESGFGETPQECIFQAIRKAKKNGFENRDLPPPQRAGQTLAGDKTPAQLSKYGSPLASELPADLGISDEEAGIVPTLGPAPSDTEFDPLPDDDLVGPGSPSNSDLDEFF